MNRSCACVLLAVGLVWLSAADVLAVKTKVWRIDEPTDLLAGTLENLAVSSRGELLAGPRMERFPLEAGRADSVNALAIGPKGVPYLGTGPNGIVYRIVQGEARQVADLPEGQVFSLLFLPEGGLLAGVGGARGTIYRIDPDSGRTSVFWRGENTRYIWSMVRDENGDIYAATGSDGEIYRISPDGTSASRLARLTNTRNVLSLTMAGANRLVFGTDGTGLIGYINTKTGRLHILHDAGERSITALVGRPDGTIFAAATSAEKASGPSEGRPQGRPDREVTTRPAADAAGSKPDPLGTPVGSATNPSRDRQRSGQSIVYRIDPTGLATEAVSLSAMLLGMTAQDGGLIMSTGNPGRIYRLEPWHERYISLVRENSSYFSAAAADEESAWIGVSRPAEVIRLSPAHAAEGTFTSQPLDAGLLSLWGQIKVEATTPPGTAVEVRTRSGNTEDAAGPGWSAWGEPAVLGRPDRPLIVSPPARFLQLRLVLKASEGGREAPVVRLVEVPYASANLAPEIRSVGVTTPDMRDKQPGTAEEWYTADSKIDIEWQATDPNGDALSYDLYVRQVDTAKWTRIAKGRTKTSYTWDSQDMTDGVYELRIVASDAGDNPPKVARSQARLSEPFVIDKAPPKITSVRIDPVTERVFEVKAVVADERTDLVAAQYSLDSSNEWIPLLPVDGLFDSPREDLWFEIGPLSPGEHVLSIRAADQRGNVKYTWRTVMGEE